MRGSIRLGKIFGIPIGIHFSWFLIFIFMTISLSLSFQDTQDWSAAHSWALGAATSLLLFVSVLLHELSHSVIAIRNGVPVQSITLFIFGGVARISRESSKPSTEFRMAIAGPMCSLALCGLFALIWWITHNSNDSIGEMTGWLSVINGSLAVFNLIPGFPLDGGRVLRSIIWGATKNYRRATNIASKIGRGIAYLMIGGGVFLLFFGYWYNGIWLIFIGWFLNNAASASYHQAEIRDSLTGLYAKDVMNRDCPLIPDNLSLRELVQAHVLPSGRRYFFVADGNLLGGIVTLNDIKAESDWDVVTVKQAMVPTANLQTACPGDPALDILERMDEAGIEQMPVLENGQIVGIIIREELLRFVQNRIDLGYSES